MHKVFLLALCGCTIEGGFQSNTMSYGDHNVTLIRGEKVTDFFLSVSTDPVEILIVVDNSCSMSNNQRELARNWPILAKNLTDLEINYRIGFTTTDPYDFGELVPLGVGESGGVIHWIEPTSENPEWLFLSGAEQGTMGYTPESGFHSIWHSVYNENNNGFYRLNSSFYPLVLSDEDEQSADIEDWFDDYYAGIEAPRLNVKNFYEWLIDFREHTTFSLIGANEFRQNKYKKMVRWTNGQKMKVDDANWNEFLGNFVYNIEPSGEFRMYLSHIPKDYKEIKIVVCEDVNHDDWCSRSYNEPDLHFIYKYNKKNWSYTYDEITNSITLSSPLRELKDGDNITVTYYKRDGL